MKTLDYDGLDYLVDKIYDALNSGGSADYIVEEDYDGAWYRRLWASGISECWCINYSIGSCAMTSPYGSGYYISKGSYSFPLASSGNRIFISAPHVSVNTYSDSGLLNASVYYIDKDVYRFYLYDTQSETKTVYINVYAKGLWKEFTPSVSAKAQVGFEDLSSQVISGTSQYSLNSSLTKCYRFGNLLYLTACGTLTADQTVAVNLPLAYIPKKVNRILVGAGSVNGSGYPRLSISTGTDGRQWLHQGFANTPKNGQPVDVWAIFLVANEE